MAMRKPALTFEPYPVGDRYGWWALTRNGQVASTSGKTYASPAHAQRALSTFLRSISEVACG